jgi:hypothetical protein
MTAFLLEDGTARGVSMKIQKQAETINLFNIAIKLI